MRGRPRDPQTQRDIMAATRELLVRDGYDQLSIDAIARRAGVSRPTIYRRWPSKAHIVFDAAFGDADGTGAFTASGDFGTDLRTFGRAALDFWRTPVVDAAALGILAERRRDPALHIRTQQLLDEQTRKALGALVTRGIEQGAVRPDVDVDMLYELLIGTVFYTVQVQNSSEADAERVMANLCALVVRGTRREDAK